VNSEIEVARINAERDIQVAKLQARQMRQADETAVAIAEVESEAEVESAVAVAEVIAATEVEEEAEPEPVVVVPEPEPEPVLEESEPPEHGGSPVPHPSKKRKGWFDSYA
jgi:hypothetical protein